MNLPTSVTQWTAGVKFFHKSKISQGDALSTAHGRFPSMGFPSRSCYVRAEPCGSWPKEPLGFAVDNKRTIKPFPCCTCARDQHRYHCSRAKTQQKVPASESKAMQTVSPASRKAQKLTAELLCLAGAPSSIFNNQREAEHGSPDSCQQSGVSPGGVYGQATSAAARVC